MTDSERNDFEPLPRSNSTASSPYLVAVLAGCITAAASLGGVALSHFYDIQGRACTRQGERLEKIKGLQDHDLKLRRLDALLAEGRIKDCEVYDEATDEREESAKSIRVAAVDKTPVIPAPPVSYVAPRTAQAAPSAQSASAPATEEPVILSGRQVAVSQDTPVVPIQPLPIASDPMPASPPAPDLVVRPPPAASNESPKPFEGAVGQTLVLTAGIDHEVIPLQYYTTTYNVTRGRVMVKLNGTPRFACHSGDSFRLFWKNKPEFVVVTYDPVANLTVTNVESGAHLGTSTCMAPLG